MESAQNVWKDSQSEGVRTSNLLGRLGEWVGGRHKPAIHKTLCTDLVIKPQRVRSTRKQRRKAGKTGALADFTQPRCQGRSGSPRLVPYKT